MERQGPLISCILPVYNGEPFLREAIESILAQTLGDFELILIDDGSQDASLAIMRGYAEKDARIVLVSRPNQGLIKTLNEGIDRARGEFIARMDADDVSLPRRFEEQAGLLAREQADLCGCHYYHIDNQGKYLSAETVPLTRASISVTLSCSVPFAHGSVMIRKATLERLALRYGMGDHRHAEDYSLWVSLYVGGACFVNADGFLFKYRDAEGSLSARNRSRIGKDTRRLSRAFLAARQAELAEAYAALLASSRSKKETELLVLSLVLDFLRRPRLERLAGLARLPRKALILGVAKALRLYTR